MLRQSEQKLSILQDLRHMHWKCLQRSKMDEKLPYGQLLLFALCNLTNSLSTSAVYPYASNMVMDFGLTRDRSETGYYAGFICGSIMIGRAFGSPVWGWLADRHGRKPILIISLLSIVCGSIALGLSRSFTGAVLSMVVSGLFCTLSAIAKTCVSEVVPSQYQAKAMSYYALGWFYGQVAGYSIGGMLVHPEKTGLVSGGVFAKFPYLLPNLVCAGIAFTALIGVMMFYKETLVKSRSVRQLSLPSAPEPPSKILKSSNVRWVVSLYALQVFCNTGFIETYPLWCWSNPAHGGLGLDAENIGLTLSCCYVTLSLVQTWEYHFVLRHAGLVAIVVSSSLLLVPVLVGMPFLGALHGTALRAALIAGCLTYYLLAFNIFTSIFVLTNNCVAQKDRAKVNGCSMGLGYIIKGLTPILVGFAFAFSSEHGHVYPLDYHFVFTVLGFGTFAGALLAFRLSRHLEQPAQEQYKEMPESFRGKELELSTDKAS